MSKKAFCFTLLVMVLGGVLAGQEPSRKSTYRLTKPFVGDEGKIYTCSERNLFAFESNGTISWSIHLNYSCHMDIAPASDGRGKIYVIAENRVLRIVPSLIGTSESIVKVFFGDTSTTGGSEEIVGISISLLISAMIINVKNRGLFAYNLRGRLLWSAGPVLYRYGYRQGCKKNATDCYFTSSPVIDQCEGSIYISNNQGELYSLSIQSPHFNWIQDYSAFDEVLIITPGNNGRLFVTVPLKALVFSLDVNTGNILWQNSIGPLSTTGCLPVIDSNGWISFGSLDGLLYSFSPTGVLKTFTKADVLDSVVQISPFLDCSGYGVYMSQTQVQGKISYTVGGYTYVSGMKPINAVFTLLNPSTGTVHWTQKDPGQILSFLSESDLHHFALDERILLAFVTANNMGNPLSCRTTRQKTVASCSQARIKHLSIYIGNEKTVILFFFFQSVVVAVLASLVRFCCIFWNKRKLQDQDLGKFLDKRHSFRVKKKELDRTITELEQKAAEEAVGNEVLEELGDLVRKREGIERKLSSAYSFGRDKEKSETPSLLPLYDGEKSYSFHGRRKERAPLFHTLSDTSSRERSTSDSSNSRNSSIDDGHPEAEAESSYSYGDETSTHKINAHTEVETSNTVGMNTVLEVSSGRSVLQRRRSMTLNIK